MKRINKDGGMFEFVFVCGGVYFLLGIREQEHMIDTCWADEQRANFHRILDSDSPCRSDELARFAIHVYNSQGMMQT